MCKAKVLKPRCGRSGSKGLDSLGIISKFVSPPKINSLLRPLRAIMQETETLKVMLKVDDALRRIAGGLNSNNHLVPKELILLCHTLIGQNSKLQKHAVKVERKRKRAKDHVIVEPKGHTGITDGHFTLRRRTGTNNLRLSYVSLQRWRITWRPLSWKVF
ncbi:hypothetical protein EDB86DRAFT_130167 [Lactarius hatsudake]|nr:hypothetical protein EDB86DRAFT_130167 [Lactarius hatsudake]